MGNNGRSRRGGCWIKKAKLLCFPTWAHCTFLPSSLLLSAVASWDMMMMMASAIGIQCEINKWLRTSQLSRSIPLLTAHSPVIGSTVARRRWTACWCTLLWLQLELMMTSNQFLGQLVTMSSEICARGTSSATPLQDTFIVATTTIFTPTATSYPLLLQIISPIGF